MKHKLLKLSILTLLLAAVFPSQALVRGTTIERGDLSDFIDNSAPISQSVLFKNKPERVCYQAVNPNPEQGLHWRIYSYSIEGLTDNMAIYVQLQDPNFADKIHFESNGQPLSVEKGGFWIPANVMHNHSTEKEFQLRIAAAEEGTVAYTVSVYPSKDLTTTPVCSSDHEIRCIKGDRFPRLSYESIKGDLNQAVPFTISLNEAGFLKGKSFKLKVSFFYSNNAIKLTCGESEIQGHNGTFMIDRPQMENNSKIVLNITASEACSDKMQVSLYDSENYLISGFMLKDYIFPYTQSQTDIDALRALQTSNPSSEIIRQFIESGDYLKDTDPYSGKRQVAVTWGATSPGRVVKFFLNDYKQQAVRSLVFSNLDELEQLTLERVKIKTLNLTNLKKLSNLRLGGTDLKWEDVQFPKEKNPNLHISGYSMLMMGTPTDPFHATVAVGTEIDLSKYATVNGQKSSFEWFESNPNENSGTPTTMPAVPNKEGAFIFKGNPNKNYFCHIKNANYGDWYLQTPVLIVAKDLASYSQQDIDALKKLAEDNPNTPQLKAFVDAKGWEKDNWNEWKDDIRTRWDWVGDCTRLTGLRIRLRSQQGMQPISTMDISAWTELKCLDVVQGCIVSDLDFSKNVKLEEVYIYTPTMKTLDLSNLTNLKRFSFGTPSMGEFAGIYKSTQLQTLNLSMCKRLDALYLEGVHLTSFDLADFPELSELSIIECKDLQVTGWDKTKVNKLNLSFTDQFKDVVANLPVSVTELDLTRTSYALPAQKAQLKMLGIPSNITSIDLQEYPNLRHLDIGSFEVSLKYSGIKNYRQGIKFSGVTQINMTKMSDQGQYIPYKNGDIIDLSSEAVINGVESVFLWVDEQTRTEEKTAIQPIAGQPGKFVIQTNEERASYYCKIMNTNFTEITPINSYSGWPMEARGISVYNKIEKKYSEQDLLVVKKIVDESTDEQLQAWWSTNKWKEPGSGNFLLEWNDENPARIQTIRLNFLEDRIAPTVNLQRLDKLKEIDFSFSNMQTIVLPSVKTNLTKLFLTSDKLTSLIVAPYTNLSELWLTSMFALKSCDVSKNTNIRKLYLNGTNLPSVEVNDLATAKRLTHYGVPRSAEKLDLAKFPQLTHLSPIGTNLTFADILNPRQLVSANGYSDFPFPADGYNQPTEYLPYGTKLDVSEQKMINGVETSILWSVNEHTIDHKGFDYIIPESLNSGDLIAACMENALFPNWRLEAYTIAYTRDGDANLDKKVNVQDVTATISYILKDTENMIPEFGDIEADVNRTEEIEIADVIGIVNIIHNLPLADNQMLRADASSSVLLSLDENNFLSIENQVPLAGLYVELTGVNEEISWLGEVAKFNAAAHLNGDTLRLIAYDLNGKVLPSGKHKVLRLPAGAHVVNAVFSDKFARSLRSGNDDMITTNERIELPEDKAMVSNYPNPFRGSTTFTYRLAYPADQVSIYVYSANGVLVSILSGLPGEMGENRYTASLPLASGVYYYRMVTSNGQQENTSNTNTLIIE